MGRLSRFASEFRVKSGPLLNPDPDADQWPPVKRTPMLESLRVEQLCFGEQL